MMAFVAEVESFGLWLTETYQSAHSGINERIQRTLNIDFPSFVRSVFSQQVFADGDGVFGRFRWVDALRTGDCSHDLVYVRL